MVFLGARVLAILSRRSSCLRPNVIRFASVLPDAAVDYETAKREFHLDVPRHFNFSSVIERWAAIEKARGRQNPALWWVDDNGNERGWSFAELVDSSKRIANLLTGICKLKRGDKLILVLPRLPEWWMVNLACIRAGIIVSPGTTQLTSHDIKYRLVTSEAACIVADGENADKIDQISDQECPDLKVRLLINGDGNRQGWIPYHDFVEETAVSNDYEMCDTLSSEPMNIFFTSGTTGFPKMALHTHASYGLGHLITGRYWLGLTPNDVFWSMSDTGWAKAYWSSLFAPWSEGATVFVHHTDSFDPRRTLQVLSSYPITSFCSAPTALRVLVHEDLKSFQFQSLRQVVSAGEPLNPEVIEQWKAGTGITIREGYGQTETTLLCGTLTGMEARLGSMGKPAPGYDIKIIDKDGNENDVGSEGEIAIKLAPKRPVGLFSGYLNDQERTESCFVGDDYYLTGDRGYFDEDGYIWFVSRSDDVIITAGYRVGPFEVESALVSHKAVLESAVVGSPDEERGTIIKAFVVLSPGYQGNEDLKSELQTHVRNVTAPYKYPRKIEFVASLPKTMSGKIRRVELRELEMKNSKSMEST